MNAKIIAVPTVGVALAGCGRTAEPLTWPTKEGYPLPRTPSPALWKCRPDGRKQHPPTGLGNPAGLPHSHKAISLF